VKGKWLGAVSTGRRRTREEIRSILEWHHQSGLSLLAFARRQGLCYASLRRWRADQESRARVEPAGSAGERPGHPRTAESLPHFVPVQLEELRSENFILEWAPGRSLRIPAGFDPDQLRRLLDALGVRP
jgi:hypothetical protein